MLLETCDGKNLLDTFYASGCNVIQRLMDDVKCQKAAKDVVAETHYEVVMVLSCKTIVKADMLATLPNLCMEMLNQLLLLYSDVKRNHELPDSFTHISLNDIPIYPLISTWRPSTNPVTLSISALTEPCPKGDTNEEFEEASGKNHQEKTTTNNHEHPPDGEKKAHENFDSAQHNTDHETSPATSQKTGVEEKPQKTVVDRLPTLDSLLLEQQPAETEDMKDTEEKLEHEKALKDLHELRPGEYFTTGDTYIVASYLDNYNPALPVSLQQQLDRMNPREFRSYLLDRMSAEQREALLIDEGQRRRTFLSDWPHAGDNLSGPTMAKAGFYYLGESDRVQCVFCRGQLFQWEENDVAMVEHARMFNFCRFVKNLPTGNIEYQSRTLTAADLQQVTSFTDQIDLDTVSLGISTTRAAMIRYAPSNARMQTFSRWPAGEMQPSEQMSQAGFYYTGQGDLVRCFFCGGGLKEWSATDDPWEEHARWFSNCLFLIDKKGQQFINDAYDRAPEGRRGEPPAARQLENAETRQRSLRPDQEMRRILQEMGHSPQAIEEVIARNGGPFEDIKQMIDALYELDEARDLEFDGAGAMMAQEPVAGTSRQHTSPAPEPSASAARDVPANTDRNDCRRCMARDNEPTPATNIGLPCGHLIFCDACRDEESRKRQSLRNYMIQCPFPRCAAPLNGTMRVFFA